MEHQGSGESKCTSLAEDNQKRRGGEIVTAIRGPWLGPRKGDSFLFDLGFLLAFIF